MTLFLGLDVGDVRVGVALSDPSALIASPLDTFLRAKGHAEQEVIKLINARAIKTVVVGLPLDEAGNSTKQGEKIKNFCRRLQKRVSVEIVFVDEYCSSIEAESHIKLYKKRKQQGKGVIDQISASIILQSYLDTKR